MPNKAIAEEYLESIEFWRSHNSHLHVTDKPFSSGKQSYKLDPAKQAPIREQMIEDGYFHIPSIIDPDEVNILRDLVLKLDETRVMSLFSNIL